MHHHFFLLILSLLLTTFHRTLQAQEAKQSISGTVIDNSTDAPVSYATVELLNHIPLKTAITDENGHFLIEGVPVGKHRLLVTQNDYEILIVPEIELTSGNVTSLDISLEKTPAELQEVVVKASKISKTTKDIPINHMAITGIRSFTIEEVKRYPLSLEDPSRLVAKFAGVTRTNAETGLAVRGNNSQTLLWRVEGLPISSPNHLSFREGSTGYLPIFNIYLLRNSDFMHGTAPAEYGNTVGGILDLGLRNGNSRNLEGSVKLSLVGLEGFIEGPLDKKGKTTFVAGGRYSLLSLFSKAGGNTFLTVPNTADFSFKIHNEAEYSETNLFWIGGISSTNIDVSELATNDIAARYIKDGVSRKVYGLIGLSRKQRLKSKKGYVYTVLGVNANLESFNMFDSISTYSQRKSSIIDATVSSYFHYVFNKKHQIRTGVLGSFHYLNLNYQRYSENKTIRDYFGNTMSFQAHAQWLYSITSKLKLNLGFNGQYLLLNNTFGLSPRFALSWQFLASHRISVGYSWNHQMQPWEAYVNLSQRQEDYGEMVDLDLGFSQNHHVSLSYDWAIVNNWRLKLEGYYQYLTNIPVNEYQPEVSLMNLSSTENLLEYTHFNNNGEGQIYGVELTVEKFFSNGYYGLLTSTFFDAMYKAGNGEWHNTETNNYFMGNLLVGKEFKIGRKKNNRIFADISYSFKMGNYYTPVDVEASIINERQISDWANAYTQRHQNFHNLDIRVGLFMNHKKANISHKFFVELSNALNQKVPYRENYNPIERSIAYHRYAGLIPNLSYRLNFGIKKKVKRL